MIMTLDSHIGVKDLDHNAEGGEGLEYELIFMDGSDFIFLFRIIVPKLELKKYFYVFFFVKKIYLILLFCVTHIYHTE